MSAQPLQRDLSSTKIIDQWERVQEENDRLKEENKQLIQELEEFSADLEDCKSRLFALRPQNHISDDSIQRGFEQIHTAINRFVWDALSDSEDNALYYSWQKKRQNPKKRQSGTVRIIRRSEMLAWRSLECSNVLILSVVIARILDHYIFLEQYPLSMTAMQMTFVRDLENGMRSSKSAKGESSIARWRSETMTALTLLPNAERQRDDNFTRICKRADAALSHWLLQSDGALASLEEKFHREILHPAMRFHEALLVSSDQARMETADISAELSPREMLNKWDLVDAESWRPVKREEHIGQVVHCLHPSLIRLRANGGPSLVLVKPTVVVAQPVTQSMSRQHSAKVKLSTTDPANIESNHASDHLASPLARHDSEGTGLVESPSSSGDSDSELASSRISNRSDESKISTSMEQAQQVRSPPRVAIIRPPSNDHQVSAGGSKYGAVRERQGSGRSGDDQYGQARVPYTIPEEGKASVLTRRAMTDNVPRRGSKDTASEPIARPKSVNSNRSLSITPLNSTQSSPSESRVLWSPWAKLNPIRRS